MTRRKNRIGQWAEDNLDYWAYVAMAAFFVWQAANADDRSSLFYLFAAGYLLIHAHGRRILAAVKKRDVTP